jgi:hypothetical protein
MTIIFSDIFYCPVIATSFGFFLKRKPLSGTFSTLWAMKDIACKYGCGCVRIFIDTVS